jgi:hypothetical protein
VPSGQPIEPTTRHPSLGPAVAVNDNQQQRWWILGFEILMIPLGLFGVYLGRTDVVGGNTWLGLAQAVGGVILVLYGIRGVVLDIQRLRNPLRLLIARDGFESCPGRRVLSEFELFPSARPISWGDVSSIGDPKYPAADPRNLRVQLYDPQGFADRQSLSIPARLMLRLNRGDLVLGNGFSMHIVKVEALMREQLAAFRGSGSVPPPAALRRPGPKRSHPSGKKGSSAPGAP